MAKKKTQAPTRTPPSSQAAKAPAAAAAPAKKSAASAKKSASPAAAPLIDTNLAANAAAAMIANKSGGGASGATSPTARKESSAFKQLKAGLNKPSAGALGGGVFGAPQQQKKAHQPFGGGKQIGHNQTLGSDATRTGVPRRTPG
jgi:hypothetical protein